MHFWRIGAAFGAIASLAGLAAMTVLKEPQSFLVDEFGEVFEFEGYKAKWGSDDLECEEFDFCVHLVITKTLACPASTIVEFTVTDQEDSFLSTQRLEVADLDLELRTPVEIGTESDGAGYFLIESISCSSLIGTEKREV